MEVFKTHKVRLACRRVTSIAASLFSVALLAVASPASAAALTNGMNATNVLGQPDFTSSASATTQSGMSAIARSAYDSANQRLFVADFGNNNRVLVFDLSGGITNGMNATNVLGQANFTTATSATSQSGMTNPRAVAYDATGNRLFVADTGNNRVLVFDLSGGITNGMNASNVLGQANFTTVAVAMTQSGMNLPAAVTYDAAGQRLFVTDSNNARVLVFDLSGGITNGMNATNVLGQANFTTAITTTTQSGVNSPYGSAYDAAGQRLFVSDDKRVLVFDLSGGITNGMNASNVLGQADFTSNASATTQSGMSISQDVAYDGTDNRLFVADYGNSRVLIFNLSGGITNGMAASNVLGQSLFTANAGATTQSRMNLPVGVTYDASNKRLFVGDTSNRRVLVFDFSVSSGSSCPSPSITLSRSNGGESFAFGASEPLFWSILGCGVTGVRLSLSTDGGASYPTLVADGVFAGSGYYSWKVPDMNTTAARLRVELIGTGGVVLASDTSDTNFIIVGTPPTAPAPSAP
ncbi:NHL repeat-containing protein, partial [Candidatus Uhrbacteria bacterium]|nr:NHL repeat-containing protein [Candidatus Uhrbacteria bacterium]